MDNIINVPSINSDIITNISTNVPTNISTNVPLQKSDTNTLINIPTNNSDKSELPNNSYDTITTNSFRTEIINDYIKPALIKDIKTKINGRNLWSKVSNRILVLSKIIMILVSIFAFAGSKFTNLWWLSFVAGILSVSALSLMQFSMFASHESKDCTQDTNLLLDSLNIKNKIIDLESNNTESN